MREADPFERQVAEEVRRAVGPEQAIDDDAIVAAARGAASRPLLSTWPRLARWHEGKRGSSMFSVMKLAATAVVLAVTGGLMVSLMPGPVAEVEQPPAAIASTEPAAETAATPAWATGVVSGHQIVGSGGRKWLDGRTTYPREVVQAQQLSTDPRLAGTLTDTHNLHEIADGDALSGGAVSGGAIIAGTMRLENEAGAWQGTYMGVREPEEPWTRHSQVLFTGEGDYEGLRALLQYDGSVGEGYRHSGSQQVKGFVFDGDLPTVPDPQE